MGYSINTSQYLHSYEAYRIPKDSPAMNAGNSSLVKEGGECPLVLTEQSRKQLIKDRLEYAFAMKAEQDKEFAKQEQEAIKKMASDQAKALAVYRSMAKGDIVPSTDENKLMEYDDKLYQAAKMAQMLAQKAEAEKQESRWDPEEEEEYQKKLEALGEAGNKLVEETNKTFGEFIEAQTSSVVEIEPNKTTLSSIKSFYNMGGGLAGAILDISL